MGLNHRSLLYQNTALPLSYAPKYLQKELHFHCVAFETTASAIGLCRHTSRVVDSNHYTFLMREVSTPALFTRDKRKVRATIPRIFPDQPLSKRCPQPAGYLPYYRRRQVPTLYALADSALALRWICQFSHISIF